jgi:16S rRNA (cytidine1402-2'-O)-methyltransferase
VARELTKVHQEVRRGRLGELASMDEPRGEVVVVIEGAGSPAAEPVSDAALAAEARQLIAAGVRKREAAGEVARRHGVAANRVYRALVDGS